MNRIRFAACTAVAALGLAIAPVVAQMDAPPAAPNDDRPAMPDRGPGGRGGMGGGAGGMMLRETFGATVRPLPREQAQANDVKPGVGLVVGAVRADSPAAKGGLKEGDIIYKLEDQWVINPQQLAVLLSIQDVDDGFELKVRRGSERVDLDYKFDQAAHDAMTKALEADPGMRGPRGGGGPGGEGGMRGPRGDGTPRSTPPADGGMNP